MSKSKRLIVIVMFLAAILVFWDLNLVETYAAKAPKSKVPVISKIVATKSNVTLYWTKTQGASKYYVYRKTGSGKYRRIANLSKKAKSYKDKKIKVGKKYVYKIIGVKKAKKYRSKGRQITPVKIKAPVLTDLEQFSSGKKECATLKWRSIKGCSYDIYRKTGQASFSKVATVKGKAGTSSYTDKTLKKDKKYTYTVKPVRQIGKILYKIGSYDTKGISTLPGKAEVGVDRTNLHALISWSEVEGASGYEVYRKQGIGGKYKTIATVKADGRGEYTYKDVYEKSLQTESEKKLLIATNFVDPSTNSLVYAVRAYSDNGKGKRSYSNYDKDGEFELAVPAIVSVTKSTPQEAVIEWSTVKNAKNYYLYTGYNDSNGNRHWTRVATVKHQSMTRQNATITVDPTHPYYTVKAASVKGGKNIYSAYDKGFSISDRMHGNKNILYIGDSITFGSPYKGATTKEVFSYPWRINQLTDVQYYNPSIPGATYSYKPYHGTGYHRYRLVTDVAEKIKDGTTPEQALHPNSQTYEDFDVVVMAAGTNDYLDDAELGDLDSQKKEEFNGAINTIMGYIEEGSKARADKGKAPIKVVFVDLFYSDRTLDYSQLTNRFTTQNKLGLTLQDYQDDIDALIKQYKAQGIDVYQFHTGDLVTQDNCPYTTSDNLHMTRFTYTQIGNKLSKFLINNAIL